MYFQDIAGILREQNVITKEQYDDLKEESIEISDKIPLDVILKSGVVTEHDIENALEKFYGVSYVNLVDRKIDSGILRIIPEKVMKDNLLVSFNIEEDYLCVATLNPRDIPTLDYLHLLTGYKIKPYVTTEFSIYNVIENYYTNEDIQSIISEIEVKSNLPNYKKMLEDQKIKETPIVKLVDVILEQAVFKRVSDIHIEPQDSSLLIRYRKDGVLRTVQYLPKIFHAPIVSRIKIISSMDIAEKRLPQDGQFKRTIGRRELDFRVSTLTGKYGEKVVIRVLDRSSFAMGLDSLGLIPATQSKLEDLIKSPMGIFLVVGPTGSGKTTTLYSVISFIRSPQINIITFEDPIEYEILAGSTREGGITQVQINPKIGFGFAEGLRTALRQDPDVIFVGEIRDSETASMAATASLTGHLVLSTLHTLDSVTAVTRLLDLGVEPFLLSATLTGVLSQRLVRLLCNKCKEKYKVPARLLKGLTIPKDEKIVTLYRPRGCRACSNSGYSGRTGVYELLNIDDKLQEMIYSKSSEQEIRKMALERGMKTMKTSGLELVYKGATSIAELIRVIPSDRTY